MLCRSGPQALSHLVVEAPDADRRHRHLRMLAMLAYEASSRGSPAPRRSSWWPQPDPPSARRRCRGLARAPRAAEKVGVGCPTLGHRPAQGEGHVALARQLLEARGAVAAV